METLLPDSRKIKSSGSIVSLCTGSTRHGPKAFTEWARLVKDVGIEDDEPAGVWHQQVGILPWEVVAKMTEKDFRFEFGQCGDNICVTSGDLSGLALGDYLIVGKALLVVTQLGKRCRNRCPTGRSTQGECDLSKNWIYASVLKSGQVCVEDSFLVIGD